MISPALCTAMIASYRKNILFWTKFISGYKLFNENRREHLWSEVYPNLIFLACKCLLHQENTNKKPNGSVRGERIFLLIVLIFLPQTFLGIFLGSYFATVWIPSFSSLSCPFQVSSLAPFIPVLFPLFLTLFFFYCPTSFLSFHSP